MQLVDRKTRIRKNYNMTQAHDDLKTHYLVQISNKIKMNMFLKSVINYWKALS